MTVSGDPDSGGAAQLPSGAARALTRLQTVLRDHPATQVQPELVIGIAGVPPSVDAALEELGVACPDAPESLVIGQLPGSRLLVAGSDELGLAYGLSEVARAFQCAAPDSDLLDAVQDRIESPALSWRSMQVFVCNRNLEAAWYYSADFWSSYLDQLVDYRYNNLSLTFGHQTPYLTPPYPFLVDMSDFTPVRLRGYGVEDRERALTALRQISEMTRERGLHFTLGIWAQRPEPFGAPMIDGLDEVDAREFNAAGLERLLAACPGIDGLQLRLNYESGIDESGQAGYFERQFRAVAACGRPIRLDLRAKGLADEVIEQARALVPDTVVSTKFWCEHLGQPYAMPVIRSEDIANYRRYGYWDLLSRPGVPLIYRLWSAGSQRALLWGAPGWVSSFVRACAAQTDGFEVMAPLSNKGGINHPGGAWRLLDGAYQPHRWEYQRYWMFSLLFGRLGYDPEADTRIWQRELRLRFGAAATPVERGYEAAGQILPLLTTVLQSSASLWSFWPEMYAGRTLKLDMAVEPSDPTQFYGVAEYVGQAIAGQLCGKWTPLQVADRLDELADECREVVVEADAELAVDNERVDRSAAAGELAGSERGGAEYRGTRLDFLIYAALASFHADRLRAMTQLAFYLRTGCGERIEAARRDFGRAREHWKELVASTDGVYHDDLVFGYRSDENYPEGLLSRDLNYRHDGHWKDRTAVVEADGRYLREIAARVRSLEVPGQHYPGERGLPPLPQIDCRLRVQAGGGRDLAVRLELSEPVGRVVCHHRPMLQFRPFSQAAMRCASAGEYELLIPISEIDSTCGLMLFFELRITGGEARRWPDWREGAPYLVVETAATGEKR